MIQIFTDLVNHVSTRERAHLRKRKAMEAATQKEMFKKIREDAAAAAKAIKDTNQLSAISKGLRPFFKIDMGQVAAATC